MQLISPFVGRIYDWYKKSAGAAWDEAAQAGVERSRRAVGHPHYQYYKAHGVRTEVMGASFRNVGQILALAGCDLLTISPELLAQLQASEAPVVRQLVRHRCEVPEAPLSEAAFRYALNDDAMATEKLAEGIRAFAVMRGKLDALIEAQR